MNIPRKDEGRGLIAIEDFVEFTVRGLKVHVHESEERLIQAARGDKLDVLEALLWRKRSKKILQDWEKKVLHGQYLRQIKEGVIKVGFGFRMEIWKGRQKVW